MNRGTGGGAALGEAGAAQSGHPAAVVRPQPASGAVPPSGGFLYLDKPAGISSFRTLAHVKRIFRGSKVGFAGTLDPAATGLLVVGIGKATRLLSFFEAMPKTYVFRVIPGLVTDTYDDGGKVLRREACVGVSRREVEKLLEAFVGDIEQVPPVYSAKKIQGRRACDRVRAGQEVHLEARMVRVHSLRLLAWAQDAWEVELVCSKGTYVRSIAHDLGAAAGCGAAASAIRRTRVGNIGVEEALQWDDTECFSSALAPAQVAVAQLPSMLLPDSATVHRLLCGNPIPPVRYRAEAGWSPGFPEATVRIVEADGGLLAIGLVKPNGMLQPTVVLAKTGDTSRFR